MSWDASDIGADIIDVRDMIKRVEELRDSKPEVDEDDTDEDKAVIAMQAEEWEENEGSELKLLEDALSEMAGCGGDEQWEGNWYPVTLVADSYFEEYAQQLAEDIGAIDSDASWPNTYIDWTAASEALQQDYTSITIDGTDYWYR